MNGYELLINSTRLIGINEPDENLKIIGLPLINAVIEELGFLPLSSLAENTGISSPDHRQALTFGTAMLICNALGDESGRNAMSQLYSRKLAKINGKNHRVRDVLPKGDWV